MQYTVREAAHRTKRSIRTIRRWRAAGMPVEVEDGRILIEETELLATLRTKIANNPTRRRLTTPRCHAAQ